MSSAVVVIGALRVNANLRCKTKLLHARRITLIVLSALVFIILRYKRLCTGFYGPTLLAFFFEKRFLVGLPRSILDFDWTTSRSHVFVSCMKTFAKVVNRHVFFI